MGSPKLYQQPVQVMPLFTVQLRNLEREAVGIWPHSDLLKVLGLDSLERLGDPLYIWPPTLEHQMFEFCGSGEVKRSRRRQI